MFAWVGAKFDSILSTYLLGVVTSLMTALAPIAFAAMTIWVIVHGWAVLRNEVTETVPTFLWKLFKIGVVLIFALNAAFYISNVSETANSLSMRVAQTFLPTSVDPATVSSPYALLDKFNDNASAQVSDILKEATIFRLDLVLAAIVFSFGSVIFLCVGLFIVTLAKVFLTFVIAVGPIFILCLAWRPTQRFFDSWLSMVLNAVVLAWFAFFTLGLSAFMGEAIVKAIQDGGGFLGPNFNVFGESMRYCVLMILLAILCFQAPSLASGLTGGAVVQQGAQMLQNFMIANGLRNAPRPPAGAGPGGVIRAGAGIPYNVGRAAGSAMRQGYDKTRVAAYKLAAMRGQKR